MVFAQSGTDSLAIARTKAKMDSIRRHRPTVALVLAGGGARGAVHSATIRHMEELGIPIDIMLGTSIGGLVGGMYAVGYTTDDIDSVFKYMDWDWVMHDKIDRSYLTFQHAEYRDRYLLSIPFYEESNNPEDSFKKRLLNSLPAGYIYGQNVNNLISTITVGYQDDMLFSDLPIPFFCVAADVVSGYTKNWYSGKIFDAMRSTMSIPAVFAPVRVDGMVLVDGGVRDNYPTNLAQELGADIIIGVDISNEERTADDIHNIGNIIGQTMFLLHQEAFEKNIKIPDVTIRPDLEGYSMMSFDTESVDSIIARGYQATMLQDSVLREIAKLTAGKGYERNLKSCDFFSDTIVIGKVKVTGVTAREEEAIKKKMGIECGQKISKKELDRLTSLLYGTRGYDVVTYELFGSDNPYELVFNCVKAPIHHVGVSARADTEEAVSLLLNVGLNRHKLYGNYLEVEAGISINPYLEVHWAYDSPDFLTINAKADLRLTDLNVFNLKNTSLNFRYLGTKQEVYFSKRNLRTFDFSLGFRNEYFHILDFRFSEDVHSFDKKYMRNDYLSVFFNTRFDNMNKGYFPTRGVDMWVSYSWAFAGFPYSFDNFHAIAADVKGIVPLGRRVALIPSFACRFLLGGEIPVPYFNVVGGSLAGRYLDQQLPFLGLSSPVSAKDILTIYRVDLRVNIGKKHYLTTIVNYLRDSNTFSDYIYGPGYFGAALEYSYDSIIGPLTANVHWSDITNTFGIYLSVGYNF